MRNLAASYSFLKLRMPVNRPSIMTSLGKCLRRIFATNEDVLAMVDHMKNLTFPGLVAVIGNVPPLQRRMTLFLNVIMKVAARNTVKHARFGVIRMIIAIFYLWNYWPFVGIEPHPLLMEHSPSSLKLWQ